MGYYAEELDEFYRERPNGRLTFLYFLKGLIAGQDTSMISKRNQIFYKNEN